jgi:hypothetical protein
LNDEADGLGDGGGLEKVVEADDVGRRNAEDFLSGSFKAPPPPPIELVLLVSAPEVLRAEESVERIRS